MADFHYKLHGRNSEITLHISRKEALKLIAGLTTQLKKRAAKGHREYFVLHVHKARMWHKLTVTHVNAHVRHVVKRVAEHDARKPWCIA